MILAESYKFKTNTWYYCIPEDFYFKYYIETLNYDRVNFILVDPKPKKVTITKDRCTLHQLNCLRFAEFLEIKDYEQKNLDLLYE